jgi:hypothetical protein
MMNHDAAHHPQTVSSGFEAAVAKSLCQEAE